MSLTMKELCKNPSREHSAGNIAAKIEPDVAEFAAQLGC